MMKGSDSLLTSILLGLVFVTLGSLRVLLIKFSANKDGKYEYLPVTVNVSAEFLKLIICFSLGLPIFIADRGWCLACKFPDKSQIWQMMKWSIPGFLYFCDNLLAFYVIKYLQPAVVVLLGNFVIITTSLLYRIILNRKLSQIQWLSMAILFLAIMSLSNQSNGSVSLDNHRHHGVNHLMEDDNSTLDKKSLEPVDSNIGDICHPKKTSFQVYNRSTIDEDELGLVHKTASASTSKLAFNKGHILILLQCILSSLANVYNEKIFKEGDGLSESIYLQNCRLYFFGVIFNLLSFIIPQAYRQHVFICGFFHGHNAYSIFLIFITALYGLTVALILKFRNNMFHVLSSQVITIVVVTASIYLLSFSPELEFFLSAPIVLLAIYNFHLGKQKDDNPRDERHHQELLLRPSNDQIFAHELLQD